MNRPAASPLIDSATGRRYHRARDAQAVMMAIGNDRTKSETILATPRNGRSRFDRFETHPTTQLSSAAVLEAVFEPRERPVYPLLAAETSRLEQKKVKARTVARGAQKV